MDEIVEKIKQLDAEMYLLSFSQQGRTEVFVQSIKLLSEYRELLRNAIEVFEKGLLDCCVTEEEGVL